MSCQDHSCLRTVLCRCDYTSRRKPAPLYQPPLPRWRTSTLPPSSVAQRRRRSCPRASFLQLRTVSCHPHIGRTLPCRPSLPLLAVRSLKQKASWITPPPNRIPRNLLTRKYLSDILFLETFHRKVVSG